MIFVAIIAIAAAVLVPYAIPALTMTLASGVTVLTTAGMIVSGLVGLTVGIVGSLLVNALIPPPKVATSERGVSPAERPTHYVSGARNRFERYASIPWLAGRLRVVPMKIALDYTELVGWNQYVRCLFGQHGRMSMTEFRIGETNLSVFEGVQIETRE